MRLLLWCGLGLLATLKDPCAPIPDPPRSRDTLWSGLDVQVSIVSPEYERTSTVLMKFSRGGAPVTLPQRTRVSCQGIRLEPTPEGYTALLRTSLRRDPEYCCDFVGEGRDVAALCIPAPERPQFSWPLESDPVPRRSDVVVRHYASSGTRVRITTQSGAGEARREEPFEPRPDDGDYPLDASGLAPGPGSITLTRELEQPLPSIELRSVRAKVSTSLTVNVVWK
jgi:hypothetical protein